MIIVITGATGSGKSKLAISLAKKLGAGIVNADAFQVYQELGIATAKPTPEMMMEAPHFLFDFIPLSESYNVSEYQKDLRSTIATLQEAGKPIIIAGGTGLYIRAGLFDYNFEKTTHVDMSEYEALDDEALYAKLMEIDPRSANSIHPHNRRRVLRAIEIFLATGHTKSSMIEEQEHKPIYDDVIFFGLKTEREQLYERVNDRVEQMFKEGLVEEDRRLVEKYGRDVGAFQAIGVKEMFPYFDGKESLEHCKELIKKNTRNYVKRQDTFFRHQFSIKWIKDENDILNYLSSLER